MVIHVISSCFSYHYDAKINTGIVKNHIYFILLLFVECLDSHPDISA